MAPCLAVLPPAPFLDPGFSPCSAGHCGAPLHTAPAPQPSMCFLPVPTQGSPRLTNLLYLLRAPSVLTCNRRPEKTLTHGRTVQLLEPFPCLVCPGFVSMFNSAPLVLLLRTKTMQSLRTQKVSVVLCHSQDSISDPFPFHHFNFQTFPEEISKMQPEVTGPS